jgi:acetolactate synthase-1/2/3 large subunit
MLCLFEGGCSGAADGYARMKDKPAMTLLHLGPGFANAIANFHNARRAGSPIFNVIGDHASWHRPADPLLNMDLESLVATVSQWQKTNETADRISQNAAEGISAAFSGQIASLILPSDHSWTKLPKSKIFPADFRFASVDQESITAAARLLRTSSKKALFLGGSSLLKEGLLAAARIASATGCDLLTDVFPARIERGAGYPIVHKLPYFPEQAAAFLSGYKSFVFAGAREPVAFFGYKDMPSFLLNEKQSRVHIGTGHQNEAEALNCLADALDAPVYQPGEAKVIASLRYPDFLKVL